MLYGKQISDVAPNFPYAEIWISNGGNDTNSGSRDAPLLTWDAAWTMRKLAPATRYSIIFDSGIWLDPTVMVFDDVGADSSETYIHGIQDGNIPRWSSGAAKIQMTNAGNIYFTGFGFYEDIEINQTGTRVCSAQFINITVYGTVSSTGIAVPANTQLLVTGSNGRITVMNTVGNDVIVPLRVQGSAYLSIESGSIDLTSVGIYYGGQLYAANSHDVTIGDLIVFGNGQINVLGGSITVNDYIEWSGGTVTVWNGGTYDHSGATVTDRDERTLSEYSKFLPGATGLAATNVQDVIVELEGLLADTWALAGTSALTAHTIITGGGLYDLTLGSAASPLNAFQVRTDSLGAALRVVSNATASSATALTVEHETTATAANGIGTHINFAVPNSTPTAVVTMGQIKVIADDITAASEDSHLELHGVIAGSVTKYMSIFSDGIAFGSTEQQVIKTAHIQLTQGDIQSLKTTPIEIIALPGSGKYIQIIGASANYAWNSTSYVLSGGTVDNIQLSQGAQVLFGTHLTGGTSMIVNPGNKIRHFQQQDGAANTAPDIGMNTAIDIDSLSDYTGAGGTIDVYVQYMIIDTA